MEGNNKAMREALVAMLDEKCKQCYINDQICTQGQECHWNGKRGCICQDKSMDKAIAALAKPPRNCNVGTAEEQSERFLVFCNNNKCPSCPCRFTPKTNCALIWAQMPYMEGEGVK